MALTAVDESEPVHVGERRYSSSEDAGKTCTVFSLLSPLASLFRRTDITVTRNICHITLITHSSIPCSSLLFFTRRYTSMRYSSLPVSALLHSTLLFSNHLLVLKLFSALIYPTLLYTYSSILLQSCLSFSLCSCCFP